MSIANGAAPPLLVWLLAVLVFLFPVVVATTDGGGSYVYTLLVLPALYFGRNWREISLLEKRILLGFVIAFVAMALSLFNTEDMREGIKFLERYLRIALLFPIYLMLRRYGFRLGHALGWGAALATLVMAGQAWYQVSVLDEGIASGYYHKIVFGDLAILWGALVAVFSLTLLRGRFGAVLAAVSGSAALYASILSHTRGSWLFVLIFLAVLLWIYRKRIASSSQALLGVAAALLVLAAAGLWQGDRFVHGIERGVKDIKIFMKNPRAGTSWGIRLNLWRNTLLLAQEHPLLGAGLGDFHQEMRDMAADKRSWSRAVADYGHAHSIYFDALANGGLVGLTATVVAYLLLPLVAFGRGLRNAITPEQRFYAMGGLVTVLAFATFGLSEALWARNPFVNTYVVCIAVMLAGMVSSNIPLVKVK
ncbi:MAG: hypothetical protein Kow0096_13050 [Thiohalomonadaceae bacterium]